jgi:hypothetical protein
MVRRVDVGWIVDGLLAVGAGERYEQESTADALKSGEFIDPVRGLTFGGWE